jgi:NADP-dependent 3-hydroxy acid dehydrogenase YdfG
MTTRYALAAAAVIGAIASTVFLLIDCEYSLYFASYHPETKPFKGQVVWIVGASSGIGASLADDLTLAGAQVVLSARREDQLKAVAQTAKQHGLEPLVLPLDITDLNSHEKAYETIIKQFGRVDKIVLNAGRSQRNIAVETSLADTKGLFDLNFFPFISLTKLVLPSMIDNKDGHIIVVSSVSGKFGTPIASSYSATKFALVSLILTLVSLLGARSPYLIDESRPLLYYACFYRLQIAWIFRCIEIGSQLFRRHCVNGLSGLC